MTGAPGAENLIRELAPQVLGILVRRHGGFEACEDAVQEALLAAAVQWPAEGVPANPKGWLITVASRRRIELSRNESARLRREQTAAALAPPGPAPAADDTLTLFLLCCHPSLTPVSQVALTLRAVGGLSTAEIARAFLVPEATVAQRISRGKQRIRASGAEFTMPPPEQRPRRMDALLHVLYLIFNEGYTASSGAALHRVDLTAEAIRLTRQLRDGLPEDGEVAGLLALMLLTDARRPARTGPDGALVRLAEQDRRQWDAGAIAEGTALITATLASAPIGPYQLQAAIAAVHDEAARYADTDWRQILALYDLLHAIAPGPMVTLGRIVAAAMVHGPQTALAQLAGAEAALAGHHRVEAVRAHLLEMAGDRRAAHAHYRLAARRTLSLPEQRYLEARAARLAPRVTFTGLRVTLPRSGPLSRQETVMTIARPTSDDLAKIAERYGLRLSQQDVESFRVLVTGALASYDEVERLYAASAPAPPDRPYEWPEPAGNELGAWYVITQISTRADGPLAGRRVAIKDNVEVAGVPMMNGSAALEGFIPRRDATVVTRLLDAGATITGKAVCEDLCFSGGSHTARTGLVRNPWDRTRSAGGSSSGSAALVAAGHADLALGGDQGGSVRIPSAFCGTVGHKPTYGLVPYTGAFPIENTLDHLGPITRTVADAAVMLAVLAGPDGLDPRQRADPPRRDYLSRLHEGVAGLRIAVVEEGFGIPGLSQPGVDETVRTAIATLEAAGARISSISIPWHRDGMHVWNVIATDGVVGQMIDGNGYGMNSAALYDPDLIVAYAKGRREHAPELSETVKLATLCGRYAIDACDGRHYAMARNLAFELTAAYDAALSGADVLVLPTLPIVASVLPAPGASREERVARSLEMIANTAPLDVSGHPATSVPAGLADGLPVGMMIVGRRFADDTCLQVAQAYETAVGGFPAPPA